MSLIESLLLASAKAAEIARLCRQNEHLFKLLVQKKDEEESNPRFVDDFKTLADVLIQETVRFDIGNKFPELKDHVYGEESNVFRNNQNEVVHIQVSYPAVTSHCLRLALNGNETATNLLTEVVHRTFALKDFGLDQIKIPEVARSDCEHFRIWIDPIDCTSEYVSGIEKTAESGIPISGLKCVTVLIGVYNVRSGLPIAGVVCQPFYKQNENKSYESKFSWGYVVGLPDQKLKKSGKICLSSTEDSRVKSKLKAAGFELVEAAGAGYKCLLVARCVVDAYVLSKSTTFKWDTCAPQALIMKIGGGIIDYRKAVDDNEMIPINYNVKHKSGIKLEDCCNEGGIIAYNNREVLEEILTALRN